MANGNGLTPKEQKALSHTLSKLEAVGSKAFLLGREGREMLLLADKIRSRLVPATPESLLADADCLFGMWEGVPAIETALASMH